MADFDDFDDIDDIDDIEDSTFLEEPVDMSAVREVQLEERKGDDRISVPRLGKHAKSAMISKRAKKISEGAPSTLNPEQLAGMNDALEIAKKEFEERVIPLQIRRDFNDGFYELWSLDEFLYIDE